MVKKARGGVPCQLGGGYFGFLECTQKGAKIGVFGFFGFFGFLQIRVRSSQRLVGVGGFCFLSFGWVEQRLVGTGG